MQRTAVMLVLCLCWSRTVTGGEILDVSVQRAGDGFVVLTTARIDAPLADVHAAITDYANLAAINPSILESRVTRREASGVQRVRTVIRVCILVFCKDVVLEQDVSEPVSGEIIAVMIPGNCDFRSGQAHWSLQAEGNSTRMRYSQVFEPDFWVPPLIGPWLMRNKLVEEVETTMRYLER